MKQQEVMTQKKERHIVTWTEQEDDVLREQIRVHGTENWTIIASKFKDKTTRQCRRRWYTYLNSDFKKGGWSPEEDMILCEAQKIFGNRWTEIAKVVSGRTDNAVKNRFSTLCKKRAKHEALAKENATSYINQSNKRVFVHDSNSAAITSDASVSLKRMRRSHLSDYPESENKLQGQYGNVVPQQLRSPFAVLAENFHNIGIVKEVANDGNQGNKIQGTYLRKDDPKVVALMQQAELLSSLALKVNRENTDQSLENAWKALQDFLNQSKESDMPTNISYMDFQLEDFKDLVDDLRSSKQETQLSRRHPDIYEESPTSSEYSSGSTLLSQSTGDISEPTHADFGGVNQDTRVGTQSVNIKENGVDEKKSGISCSARTNQEEIFLACDKTRNNDVPVSALSSTDFSSPVQVTPLFRSLADAIPSPKFSESERNFLLKTLGVESPSTKSRCNVSEPPLCKRTLTNLF